MSLIINENDIKYKELITRIKKSYKSSQIKAATSVNSEMLRFYWNLGEEIFKLDVINKYGSGFYSKLSFDLRKAIPNTKGFSVSNLKYMRRFFELYSVLNRQQLVDNLEKKSNNVDLTKIFNVPWGHHIYILNKCGSDINKAIFFVNKIIENGWSRSVLLNFLDTNLYERQGKGITNFSNTLPSVQSELAIEMIKDPYNFDFISITEKYNEKELKDALMDNIQKFLLELGKGFAFVGREYRLVVGNTEEFIDMLFYNIKLKCYIVIEVKVRDFNPSDIGQLGTYVTSVNHILKDEKDAETIGLIICKTKDNILAKYASESIKVPVGISEYQISNLIHEHFKETLPSIEEIESELK
ncbi:PDDEXK nuclease domain-containing protein [Oceanivirga salmonicida]|uniref:PDDEXK nuclease domain-containing protein n=1 Tax=Oceanivirga salmonicida TaxID=1769291 RepID=UPI0012E319BD|nr:PDDEXK nuclease domain-containing protein [Oceanivirga salmonicida]